MENMKVSSAFPEDEEWLDSSLWFAEYSKGNESMTMEDRRLPTKQQQPPHMLPPLVATDGLPCGKITGYSLRLQNCSGSSESHCLRHFYVYVPQTVCSQAGHANSREAEDTLPLVFALHCFGCSHLRMKEPWMQVANDFSFVLVMPEGIERSWNAQACCGKARNNDINDIDFLSQVMDQLQEAPIQDAAGHSLGSTSRVQRSAAYSLGWSNGAFMSTNAASLFRAIAPISGYVYSDPPPGTALFMHHSDDDPYVRIAGCCLDESMPKCCCMISQWGGEHCVSAQSMFRLWSLVNECQLTTTQKNDLGLDHDGSVVSLRNQEKRVTCYTALNCKLNTTLCVYSGYGHFQEVIGNFPLAEEIGHFFAQDFCENYGNGIWSRADRQCTCGQSGSTPKGSYCIPTKDDTTNGGTTAQDSLSQVTSQTEIGESPIYVALLALALLLCLAFIKRGRRQTNMKAEDSEYEPVLTNEPDNISNVELTKI